MTVERRNFLKGAMAAFGGVALGAGATGLRTDAAAGAEPPAAAVPGIAFHGPHQAGILTERQAAAAFVSFDLTARDRTELIGVMRTLTDRVRALTAGGPAAPVGISGPQADSGILGDPAPADGLTVTVGLGASAFDHRYGLAALAPRRLRPMDTFPGDDLDPSRCDGDLFVQLAAHDADAVIHALRDITKHTRGGLAVRWRSNGFVPPPRPSGAPRNLLGFKDGIANPDVSDAAEMNRLVWVRPGAGEPAWATDGTYVAVRIIRMLTEFWDRIDLSEQERIIGRRRDSGAPLSGNTERDRPDYRDDPMGAAIPLDAHIRRANPRTPSTGDSRILRRGYSYDAGLDTNGDLDMGLVFVCFQQDLDRQFVAVQQRLNGEALADYILPVGGGYYFALPGVTDRRDWYGRALLEA